MRGYLDIDKKIIVAALTEDPLILGALMSSSPFHHAIDSSGISLSRGRFWTDRPPSLSVVTAVIQFVSHRRMARDLAARPNREISIRLGFRPQPQLPLLSNVAESRFGFGLLRLQRQDTESGNVTNAPLSAAQASTQNRLIVFARSSPF